MNPPEDKKWYRKPGVVLGALAIGASAFAFGGDSQPQTAPLTETVVAPVVVPVSAPVTETEYIIPVVKKNTPAQETYSPPEPVVQKSECHSSYSGCLKANAGDYDCAGGSGNGPNYTGKVEVIGPDVFDLDRDGDGWGCE